jgi:hypothetical protein
LRNGFVGRKGGYVLDNFFSCGGGLGGKVGAFI